MILVLVKIIRFYYWYIKYVIHSRFAFANCHRIYGEWIFRQIFKGKWNLNIKFIDVIAIFSCLFINIATIPVILRKTMES